MESAISFFRFSTGFEKSVPLLPINQGRATNVSNSTVGGTGKDSTTKTNLETTKSNTTGQSGPTAKDLIG